MKNWKIWSMYAFFVSDMTKIKMTKVEKYEPTWKMWKLENQIENKTKHGCRLVATNNNLLKHEAYKTTWSERPKT